LDLDKFRIKINYDCRIIDKTILIFIANLKNNNMVEPLLSGIVLGLITVSATGLFVAAFLQYRRGSQFEL
jgi:cytochrome b6-f complex subunit 5